MNIRKLPRETHRNFVATIGGGPGSGKTSAGYGLKVAFGLVAEPADVPIIADMSAILGHQSRKNSQLGRRLCEIRNELKPHQLYPDFITICAASEHIHEICALERKRAGKGVIFIGSPRTGKQRGYEEEAGVNGNFMLILLQILREYAERMVIERDRKLGKTRHDTSVFDGRWEIHERGTESLIRHVQKHKQLLHVVKRPELGFIDTQRAILNYLIQNNHTAEETRQMLIRTLTLSEPGNCHETLLEMAAFVENPDSLSEANRIKWQEVFNQPLTGFN